MKDRVKDFIRVALMIGVCVGGIFLLMQLKGKANTPTNPPPPPTVDTASVPAFMEKSAREGLKEALSHYDIVCPEIVYAQAVLETGHFKSMSCLRYHNLFGLYDSKAKRYYRFNHWSESVVAYREWVQKRYKPPEDYYMFLQRIGYAEDPRYIAKLKQIVKKQDDKRRHAEGDTLS